MKKGIVEGSIVVLTLVCMLGATVCAAAGTNPFFELKTHPTPLSSNLVAYWDFNEGNGTVVHDKSGNGNDGVNHGATWVTNGVIGGALDFNSISYVSFNSPVVSVAPFSVCAWVKPDSLSDYQNHYVFANGGETGSHQGIYLNIEWEAGLNGAYSFGVTLPTLKGYSHYRSSTTNWTFLCGTWDGVVNSSHLKLYVNGTLVGTSRNVTPTPGSVRDFVIGACTNGDYHFKGLIDEVRVYNKALSPGEVSDLNNILAVNGVAKPGVNLNITNIGPTNAINVDWDIKVTGGMLGLINVHKNGTIPIIAPDKSVLVGSGVIFGLGKIQITTQVDEITSTTMGTQLFFFTLP